MAEADDVVAIGQLIAAFNHCVDFGDGVRFAALFSPDGTLDMGHVRIDGQPALAAFAAGVKDRVPNPRHLVSNTWVEVDGDRARARSYAQVFITPPGAPTELKSAGRYQDDLERTRDGWRFVLRRFESDPA